MKNYRLVFSILGLLTALFSAVESKDEVVNKQFSFIKEIYSESCALVIGINKYQNVEPLTYAVNDAIAVENMLIEKYGFKKQNIKLIIDENATNDNILAGFSDILMDEETYFFVKDDYEIKDIGIHDLKGFEKPIQIYKIN